MAIRLKYGIKVKKKLQEVESKQRKKQFCIYCKGKAKRIAKGIWLCKKCGKKFASNTYYLE